MLTIKTNKNNCKKSYKKLDISKITTGATSIDEIIIACSKNHVLMENDTVVFSRKDGETISFFEEVPVNTVMDSTGFTVNGFQSYVFDVNGYKPSWIKYSEQIYPNNYYTVITLDDGTTIDITGDTLNFENVGYLGSQIQDIKISNKVTTIENGTFSGATSLV